MPYNKFTDKDQKWKPEDFMPPLSKEEWSIIDTRSDFEKKFDELGYLASEWQISDCINSAESLQDIKRLLNWLAVEGRLNIKD